MSEVDRGELGAIFVGGMAGAMLRAALARAFPDAAGRWPWTTFAINITGAFLLGYLVTRLQERLPLSTYRRPLLATGFCGAFTTFSTMQLELLRMLDRHHYVLAAIYAGASVLAGYLSICIATSLVRRVRMIA